MGKLGEVIHQTRDEAGPICVYQNGERRVLTLGTEVEQSCVLLSDPIRLEYVYTQAMMLSLLLTPHSDKALLLGLGGGSLARALSGIRPRCRISAAEFRGHAGRAF